jgi:hypothetical protein
MSFFGAGAGGAGVGSSGFFGKSARVVPGDQFGEVEKDPLPSDDHTWEIEEGHSNRVKAQFQWDEANEGGADTGVEFTGGRKELLALDRIIEKQMQWAAGAESRLERLDSHRAPETVRGIAMKKKGKSKGPNYYVVDDGGPHGEEKGDTEGFMSGVSDAKDGKAAVRPQALASDEQVKGKLLTVMKENKKLMKTLHELRDRHRAKLKQLNKLSSDLAHAQDDLEHARHNVNSGGGGMFAAKVNVNSVTQKESEERAKREKERKKLLQQGTEDEEGDAFALGEEGIGFGFIGQLRRRLKKWWAKNAPLTKDVEQIEARFGSSVAGYYSFNRWVTINSLSIFAVYTFVLVLHLTTKAVNPVDDDYEMTPDYTDFGTTLTSMASMVLYSAFTPDNAILYSTLLISLNAVLMFIAVRKWVAEDYKMKVIRALQGTEKKYTSLALNCFDHTLHDQSNMVDHLMGNAETFTTMLIDEVIASKKSGRTRIEKIRLYSRRAVLIFIYIILQCVAIGGIVALIIYSATVENAIYGDDDALRNSIPIDIVPVCVSVINTIIPQVITRLVKLEKWDDAGMTVKQIVGRIFLSKTINNLIQLLSYALLSNAFFLQQSSKLFNWLPDLLTAAFVRSQISKKFDYGAFKCRGDMAGVSLFNMMITEFVMHKIFLVLFPGIFWIIAKVKKKQMKKTPFKIELKMIGLLYYQQICLISLPLYPLAGTLMFVTQILNFKSEKIVMMWSNIKPKGGGSSNSANFFLKFFLLSCIISVGYCTFLLTFSTFPKTCEIQAVSLPQVYKKAEIAYSSDHSVSKSKKSDDTGYFTAVETDTYLLTGDYVNPMLLNAQPNSTSVGLQEIDEKGGKDRGRLDYLGDYTKTEEIGKPANSECIGFLNDVLILKKSDGNYTSDITEAAVFEVREKDYSNTKTLARNSLRPKRFQEAKDVSLAFLSTVSEVTNKQLILCSCLHSCGPFSESFNGLSPLTASTGSLADILFLLTDTRFLFAIVCVLIVQPVFMDNTLKTQEDFHQEHEYAYRELIKSLTKRNSQLQKKVNMLET